MKNIYPNIVKKLSEALKDLRKLSFKWLNSLKKDFTFHNKNTELLAIWTVLFLIITGLFVLALNSDILVMFALFTLSVAVTLAITFSAIRYLHAIKYHKENQILPKAHVFFNKSLKLRSLLRFVKIPHISFKHLIKRNFKFAS